MFKIFHNLFHKLIVLINATQQMLSIWVYPSVFHYVWSIGINFIKRFMDSNKCHFRLNFHQFIIIIYFRDFFGQTLSYIFHCFDKETAVHCLRRTLSKSFSCSSSFICIKIYKGFQLRFLFEWTYFMKFFTNDTMFNINFQHRLVNKISFLDCLN